MEHESSYDPAVLSESQRKRLASAVRQCREMNALFGLLRALSISFGLLRSPAAPAVSAPLAK
eukprot:10795567-Karenia_brevis.AAC.1